MKEFNLKSAELLKKILANQYVLYTKARNYHWNVEGHLFRSLHVEFENIYNGLADDIDVIAERIRVFGVYAPGTMSEFLKIADLKEEIEGKIPSQIDMLKNIISDFDFLILELKKASKNFASEFEDDVTAGILFGYIEKYEKLIWMLKSLLA